MSIWTVKSFPVSVPETIAPVLTPLFNALLAYLDIKHDEILNNSLSETNYLTDQIVKKYNKLNNAPTKLNQKYN